MTNIKNKLNQKIFKNIDDVLVIKDRHIPIQFCIQNWGEPFNRPLLKKAVEKVLTSKSLDIVAIDRIYVSLEIVKYSRDKSPTGMKDIEYQTMSENGQVNTVIMSDRFSWNMENIVIKVVFKSEEVRCFVRPTLPSDIGEYSPLNHIDFDEICSP
jgi:hypothetical protein